MTKEISRRTSVMTRSAARLRKAESNEDEAETQNRRSEVNSESSDEGNLLQNISVAATKGVGSSPEEETRIEEEHTEENLAGESEHQILDDSVLGLESLLQVQLAKLLKGMYQEGVLSPGPKFDEYINNNKEKQNKNQEKLKNKEKERDIIEYMEKKKEENRINDRPILQSLDAEEVARFLVMFENYEEVIVKGIIGLEEATITRSLSYKTILELQMAGVNPVNRLEVMEYLKRLNEQSWAAQKHTLLQRAAKKIKWKNLGDVHTSMRKLISIADGLVLGMNLSMDPYLNKAYSLLVLKKLPLTFKGKDAQYMQKSRGWKDYNKMKKELLSLSILLSAHDYVDPLMKMNQGPEEKPLSRKSENKPPQEEGPRKIAIEETRYGKRHKLPSWWSKDQKRKYGMDKTLCLYCFTDSHRAVGCPLLANKGTAKKLIAIPITDRSLELQPKVISELLGELDVLENSSKENPTHSGIDEVKGRAYMVRQTNKISLSTPPVTEKEPMEAGEEGDVVSRFVENNEPGFFDNIVRDADEAK
eukprot:snap_masked-scaffold_23-processed-gene-3.25-mRNA-1 protein AED:1.00 eAED:1.00 QI:0/-1/0/0/-1/1/1/0/531